MPCDYFTIDSAGKAIIETYIGEKLEEGLDVIKLPSGRYLVNKGYLRGLKEFTPETLKDTHIYIWIGANKEETRGDTTEIRNSVKKDKLEEFIREIKSIKDIKKFLS